MPSASQWQKSSYSFANHDCVEVAQDDGAVHVRDSKDPAGPVLSFTPEEWTAFLEWLRTHEYQDGARHRP
jgi:hypothetical protein